MKRLAVLTQSVDVFPFVLEGCGEKSIKNLAVVCEQLKDEIQPLETITLAWVR
jgi:hypothetical protein